MGITKKQFAERVNAALAEEAREAERFWYLSFASEEEGFIGVVIMKAHGMTHARLSFALHGIKSPGGEMLAIPMPDEAVPPEKYHNRLLDKKEIQDFWPDAKTIREHEEDENDNLHAAP